MKINQLTSQNCTVTTRSRTTVLSVLSLLVLSVSPTVLLAGTQPWGTALGSFNGIVNYSDNPTTMPSPQPSSYINGQYMGLEWECVEYVRRYYYSVYQLNLYNLGGPMDAWQFFGNAANMHLTAYGEGGTVAPQVGDILCFNQTGTGRGHVAIVRAVGSTTVTVIQQNVKNGDTGPNGPDNSYNFNYSPTTHVVDVLSAGSSHLGSTFYCQGWLRKSAALPAPSITSVSPSSPTGSSSSQPFYINGANFVSGCNVTLRDITAGQTFANRTITSFSSTQIRIDPVFTTAAHTWSVEVINPDGQSSGQYQFNVQAPSAAPSITSVSPSSPTGSSSSQPFYINGANFVSGCNVTLRDITAGQTFANRTITSFSSTQIRIDPVFTTAAHTWSVEVINPDGQSSGQYQFNVQAPSAAPSITSVSPSSPTGSSSSQPFYINGANFVSGCNVTLRDITAGQTFANRTITSFSSTQIRIDPVFTTAAHTWSVEVINPDGQSSGQYQFQVAAASPEVYNPQSAVAYARKYANYVCSDGYFWEWSAVCANVGAGQPVPTGASCDGNIGDDCAHFVSCCIGSEPNEAGGSLVVPNTSGTGAYGNPSAHGLTEWLLGSGGAVEGASVSDLSPGDLIA